MSARVRLTAAFLCAAVALVGLLRHEVPGPAPRAPATLVTILTQLAAGRALLTLFPPGQPGSHAPRHLTATLGWSWLLGRPFASPSPLAGVGVPFALVVALAFAFLGPGRMEPRHDRAPGSARGVERIGLWFPLALGAVALLRFPVPHAVDTSATAAALWIAPTAAQRASRSTALVLSTAGVLLLPFATRPAGLAALAAAAAVPWLVRADRRASWCVAFCLGSLAASGAWLAAGAGAAGLAVATARPARRHVALVLAVACAGGWLLHVGGSSWGAAAP